jgi:hypothetical protein
MIVSRHQNVGQNYNSLTLNKSFEILAEFKYLEARVTNKNRIQEFLLSVFCLPVYS